MNNPAYLYTTEQIRAVFFKTFKMRLEWFNYIGSDEANQAYTKIAWDVFLDNLEAERCA